MTIKELLKRIDELQAKINSFGKLSEDVLKKIQYKFRLDWNYHSNAIEGNSLTRQETRSVMINNITIEGKPLKDVMEVRGHDNVITDILKIGKGELRLSEKRVKEIHKAIMHEDDVAKQPKIGQWKTENNHLINYKNEKFDFVPYSEVSSKMHELLSFLNKECDKIIRKDKDAVHPVYLAFYFHLQYVTIHPFYDGNGRTARIFTNLILISFGFPPIIVKIEEKNAYYQFLADIQAYGGSPDFYYEFMCNLLIRSQKIMLDAIEGKDIEEEEDLEKEIFIWKKQLKETKTEVTSKSNELIYEIYQKSIRPLFVLFISKLKKFDDVFDSKKIKSYFNNTSDGKNSELNYIDHKFKEWLNDNSVLNVIMAKVNEYEFKKIGVDIDLIGFKRNDTNTFTIHNNLTVEFDQYVYRIKYQGKQIAEQLYSKDLDLDARESLTNECLRLAFEQIKSNMKGN